MALEAVRAALSGGRADDEAVRPLRRGGRWQAHALLRSPRVQPGHGVDERDEEEEEQRAEGDGADSGPRGRH